MAGKRTLFRVLYLSRFVVMRFVDRLMAYSLPSLFPRTLNTSPNEPSPSCDNQNVLRSQNSTGNTRAALPEALGQSSDPAVLRIQYEHVESRTLQMFTNACSM
jgi:hypothetical protein